MCLKSDKHPCVTLALIASMPSVLKLFKINASRKPTAKRFQELLRKLSFQFFNTSYNFPSVLNNTGKKKEGFLNIVIEIFR